MNVIPVDFVQLEPPLVAGPTKNSPGTRAAPRARLIFLRCFCSVSVGSPAEFNRIAWSYWFQLPSGVIYKMILDLARSKQWVPMRRQRSDAKSKIGQCHLFRAASAVFCVAMTRAFNFAASASARPTFVAAENERTGVQLPRFIAWSTERNGPNNKRSKGRGQSCRTAPGCLATRRSVGMPFPIKRSGVSPGLLIQSITRCSWSIDTILVVC